MRSEETQKILNNMSVQDKFERTTRKAFEERGTLIQSFENWYITTNEFPHSDRGPDQLVLWKKNKCWTDIQKMWGSRDLEEILREYWLKGYTIIMHPHHMQSVPFRTHFHLYRE